MAVAADGWQVACDLVDYAIEHLDLDSADKVWARNQVLAILGCDGPAGNDAAAMGCPAESSCPPASGNVPGSEEASAAAYPTDPSCLSAPGGTSGLKRASAPDGAFLPSSASAFDEFAGAEAKEYPFSSNNLENLLERATAAALSSGVVQDSAACKEQFVAKLMGALMPRPSRVNATFNHIMATQGSKAACDYLFRLCCDSAYVHLAAIARNIQWTTPSQWGDLQITINRSKPEKDPRDIAAAAAATQSGRGSSYPACQLCIENEGYAGRLPGNPAGPHPARQNLRIVPVDLGGATWGLQYSPYSYFSQHCIVLNPVHEPMHIDGTTFGRLLSFVEHFPHYFIGSNADLPVVGGSILSHDHYQGGAHRFPMDDAPVVQKFCISEFPQVNCGVVKWPLTVLRLCSANRQDLLGAAERVLEVWRNYRDETVGIVARTGEIRHNTITPIAHFDATMGEYRLDLALRCNIANDAHPLGEFHPHEELHHIKKENIGLIEVMGLAILPGRLADELQAVGDVLVCARDSAKASSRLVQDSESQHPVSASGTSFVVSGRTDDSTRSSENAAECEGGAASACPHSGIGGRSAGFDARSLEDVRIRLEAQPATAAHAAWAVQVVQRHPELTVATCQDILHAEVGDVFRRVLEDCGVFKWDSRGRSALARFLSQL